MEKPIFGSDAAKRFNRELLDAVESLAGIAEMYGAQTLAFIVYLQQAILVGSYIELLPDDEPAILGILEGMPSHEQWMRFVHVRIEGQDDQPFVPVCRQHGVQDVTLRTDVPNEVLELLLFEGEPQNRSREELEAQFSKCSAIPYLKKWLGEPPERMELLEQAKALGSNTIDEMLEHDVWLLINGSQKHRDWFRRILAQSKGE